MYGNGFSASFQHFSRLALREAIVFSSGSNFSVIILLQFLVVHWFNIHTYKNLPLSARHFLILMKEGWQNRPLFRHPSHDWKLPVHWLGYDWKWSAFFMSEALLYDKVYSLSPSYISPKPYHWRNKYSHEGCLRSEYGQRRPSYFFFSLQIAFLPVRSGQSLILEMKKAEGWYPKALKTRLKSSCRLINDGV